MAFADDMERLSEIGECRIISGSPEAHEGDPLDAWLEVEVRGLRLRLVRDRGRDHVDVKCADGRDGRWVPLEIVAVALDEKYLDNYIAAFKATLDAPDEDPMPGSAAMPEGTIRFVAEKAGVLAEHAADAKRIWAAESRIATKTRRILEQHAVDEDDHRGQQHDPL